MVIDVPRGQFLVELIFLVSLSPVFDLEDFQAFSRFGSVLVAGVAAAIPLALFSTAPTSNSVPCPTLSLGTSVTVATHLVELPAWLIGARATTSQLVPEMEIVLQDLSASSKVVAATKTFVSRSAKQISLNPLAVSNLLPLQHAAMLPTSFSNVPREYAVLLQVTDVLLRAL